MAISRTAILSRFGARGLVSDPRFQPALRLAAAMLGGISVLVVAAALLSVIS